MGDLDFETLDKLFFVGVPIVDADVRERFRRLWYDRPYWSADTTGQSAEKIPRGMNVRPPLAGGGPFDLGQSAYANMPGTFTGSNFQGYNKFLKNFFLKNLTQIP